MTVLSNYFTVRAVEAVSSKMILPSVLLLCSYKLFLLIDTEISSFTPVI